MPKWVCRIKLRVLEIRPERVQSITPEDAVAEGVSSRMAFAELWDSITPYTWDQNPWVWAVRFETILMNSNNGGNSDGGNLQE